MVGASRFVRGAVGVTGELLITAGVLLLLFLTWQLWWTDVRAVAAQGARTDQLQRDWDVSVAEALPRPDPSTDAADPPVVPGPAEGETFAIVHVPRFGDDYAPRPVLEGVTQDVLREGVGHYPGTALPGAIGNLALAGHRVTYGKPLNQIEELRAGDAVVVETQQAWFTYRVTSTRIVLPQDVDVIAAVPGDPLATPTERMLTLTTCHPMFSARQRYIVHAALDEWQPRAEGTPASLGP